MKKPDHYLSLCRKRAALFLFYVAMATFLLMSAPVDAGAKTAAHQKGTADVAISGRVKNEKGEPLAGAEIFFDGKPVARTADDGSFRFELKDADIKAGTITITYPKLMSTGRSYHPAMLSADYEIILEENPCCIAVNRIPSMELEFTGKKLFLDNNMNTQLSSLAAQLRQHPEMRVDIIRYENADAGLSLKRQEHIRNYFVEKEGISGDRFNFKTVASNERSQNIVTLMVTGRRN